MQTTRIFAFILTLIAALASPGGALAANIVWVSDNGPAGFTNSAVAGTADDVFTTNFLAGHNVIRFNSDNAATTPLTQADIDALNTNDLIILGRSLGSGAFGGLQGGQWNTNITKPLMVQSSFLTRSNLLGWFIGTSAINGVPMPLTIGNSTDPENAYLFAGVALNGGTNTASNYDEALDQNTSQTIDAPVSGANILARGFGTNNVIVELPAGTAVRPGGLNVLAGYRMYFASGTREVTGVQTAGKDNLTPTGESIFLRAVALAINNGVSPTLGQSPAVTAQPTNVAACAGLPASLSVAATGEDPLRYQWFFSDGATFTNAVAGATNATLSFNTLHATNAGFYAAVITNVVGSVTSDVAAVTITGNGTVASAVASQTNCPGSSATFTTTASGSGTLAYTWRKGATIVQGPDGNDTFTIPSVTSADAGAYSVTVAGDCNSVSNNFSLTVVAAPTISAHPQNQTTPLGNGAVFTVAASTLATQPTTYQWQTNGVDVTGANGSTFAISNLTLAASGMQVQVAVSNCAGGLLSSAATLTVVPVIGISFDFNTPGQYTNAPFNLIGNDWMNSAIIGGLNNQMIPVVPFEVPTGGVGAAPGSGALDLAFGSANVNSSTLHSTPFDFSLPGKTLVASVMIKMKAPAANSRSTQIGFTTATNLDLDNSAGRAYATVILQSTAQPSMNYDIRYGSKNLAVNSFIEGTNTASAATLTAGRWYRLITTLTNTSATVAGTYSVSGTLQDMGTDGLGAPATVASFSTTITNVDVTASRNLFFVLRGIENTGIDFWDNAFAHSSFGDVAFVREPASQTVLQGRTASFRAEVDGAGPYTYQWNKNGSPILGANNWKYTTPGLLVSDNGAEYTVTVTGPNNSVTSVPAVVAVQADALEVLSVGSVDGCIIGLRFDQPVDETSAETAANYTINGVPAVSAQLRDYNNIPHNNFQKLRTNGTEVLLTPAAPITGPFTVTVANVTSVSGTPIGVNNTANGVVAGLTGFDVDPVSQVNGQAGTIPGYNYSFAPGQFEIGGGGLDIFGNFDGFRFVYTEVTGDFDVKVRIPYLDLLRTPNKAGFDARVSLDSFSPHVGAFANPLAPGRNIMEGTTRPTWNVATAGWGNNAPHVAGFPNVWLRFRRVGNTFMRYSSTNGINWQFDGQTSPSPAFPETLYFGFAVCANVGGTALQQVITGQFDSFGGFAGYSGATIAITGHPTNVTVAAGSATTLGATATISGGGVPSTAGELTYLWQRTNSATGGWTNLPTAGATNNTVSSGTLFSSDNGAEYRVIVSAPGASSVTSSVARVTVTDTAVPTIAASSLPAGATHQILLTFSEPVSAATALNTANYVVTNAAGVVFGVANVSFLGSDPRVVIVTVSNVLAAGNYGVRVTGVQDLNGNTLAAVVRTFSQSFVPPQAPVVVEIVQNITGGDLTALGNYTNHARFTSRQPDLITYSNLFAHQLSLANSGMDNYGARVFSLFVAPSNGTYKFWMRSDDASLLFMNTNGPTRAGRAQIGSLGAFTGNYTLVGQNISLTNGQAYYLEALVKEGTGGDGISVAVRAQADGATPPNTEVIQAALLRFPAAETIASPVVVEFYTGLGGATLADQLTAYNSPNVIAGQFNAAAYAPGLGAFRDLANSGTDNYLGRIFSYFVPPTNGHYRFYFRSDDSSQFYMNTNEVNSTDPAGKVLLGQVNGFVGATYDPSRSAQNVWLVGGQRYYIEGLWKEATGGDGMTVAVRAQGDPATPPAAEFITAGMLDFPLPLSRAGAVNVVGFLPSNPTVSEGSTILFVPQFIGGSLPYGITWLKNGIPVFANSLTYITPPLTSEDDGAVFTVVITNLFSRFERSSTVTVNADTTAPTITSAVASQYGDSVLVTFSERVDQMTAGCLPNYSIAGLTILGLDLDEQRGNRVTLRTSPQTPGTVYTLTVNGVRDLSTAGNPTAGASINFSSWTVGGLGGVYVEIFTNIPGTSVDNLLQDPRYIDNLPDVSYYTNAFVVGSYALAPNGGDSGLNNYGARISGFYMPPSNGLYQFFIRSDDGSRLYMNTNGSSIADRVQIARNDNANPTLYNNGLGLGVAGANASPIISLTNGTSYYLEGLLKEGGGGDFLVVHVRAVDPVTLQPIGLAAPALFDQISGAFFSAPGNPDVNRITVFQAPPAELTVQESDPVNLVLGATLLPPSVNSATSYQWQRSNTVTGTFTNIPGATSTNLSFFAPLEADGATYRILVSLPGTNAAFQTLLHVTSDTTLPFLVSANSLDGNTIGVRFNEPVDIGTGGEPSNYLIDGTPAVGAVVRTNIDPRTVILTPQTPVSGTYTVEASVADTSTGQNFGVSTVSGTVQNLTPMDIGAPAGAGSSFTDTNNEIDVVAGGADIWGASDQGHVVLGARTGNFDIWTQLPSLSRAALDNDGITKAGLMVRETLDANARKLHYLAEPPASIGGRDIIEAGQRPTVGAATAAWSGGNGNNGVPAGMPNTWLRIKRVGDLFTAYRSSNGVDWVQTTTHTMSFSNTVYVGLAATAHIPSPSAATVLAKFRNVHIPNPPTITVQPSPAAQTVPLHSVVTYSVAGTNPPNSGPLAYQWRLNDAIIPGATNDTFTLTNAQVSDSGTYTVGLGNDGGAIISLPVTLVVSNALITATNDSITVAQGGTTNITATDLSANDSDPDGDPISVIGVSGLYPASFITDFNSGVPAGSAIHGNAVVDSTGGVDNSGALKLTMNANSQSGAFILDDLSPGESISAFNARFKLRIGDGSAEPADGFSFNFAPDLPIAATGPRAAEDGMGTGFSFSVDNYRFAPYPAGGTANTAGMKVRYGGVDVAGVRIPSAWNNPRYIDVSISVSANGLATVTVDGTNVFGTLTLPGYTARSGRFGLYARTGGQNMSQWVDNLAITSVSTVETAAGGRVALTNGIVTYQAPACGGTDTFYYLVSDGQVDGVVPGVVNASIVETNPAAPVFVTCATNRTYTLYTNSQIALPDLRGELVATDDCGVPTLSQSPPPGTLLNEGAHVVTFTATDATGSNATCQATITVALNRPTFSPGSARYNANDNTFSASFQTANGVNYRVEYKNDLNDANWTFLTNVAGDGTVKTFTDPGPLPPMRFYRIVPQP